MSDITTPADDTLDPASPQPVHYAEQALLGALLLEPHRLQMLGDMAPEQFADATHRALFAALRTVPLPDAEQHARNATWLSTVLAAARERMPTLPTSYPHQLVQACPWPQHLPAYAQIVKGEHVRRLLRAHAIDLAQAAADASHPDPVAEVLARSDALAALLDRLTEQFASHPGSMPRRPPPSPPGERPSAEAVEEERMLLASATAHPSELAETRWLMPGDFVLPLHATLWECLTALAHRGADIDPVTVLWEAQHRGVLQPAGHAGTTPEEILAIVSSPAGSLAYWAEKILRRSVLTHARGLAATITSLTATPANTPRQLVTGSRRALAEFTTVINRLRHATTPAPRARPATRATPARPRAGPPALRATR
ncbi:DnaB-like helicase N-terminal domain-containing protein [Streptomyces fragilis]|uniref:DnaB-like helicase N-terminal domain-containing protein n=1 Tax=Streptomyces fragilis TaxID=67301 RepID=A0ABV2YCB8_9ACTN|nr:DnaB-like helicase N-terminal domain-containing protein [Streptomyces fragilis]